MSPLVISVLFLLVILLIHPTAQYVSHQQAKHMNGHIVLPDILHNILPHNEDYKHVGDYMGMLVGIAYFFLAIKYGNKTDFFDWVKVLAIIYLLKSFTIVATGIPDPQDKCEYINFLNLGACNDCLFSCHTAFIAATLLFLSLLLPNSFIPLLIMYFLVAAFFIISTHNHYTVDVIMGLYVAITLFLLRDKF